MRSRGIPSNHARWRQPCPRWRRSLGACKRCVYHRLLHLWPRTVRAVRCHLSTISIVLAAFRMQQLKIIVKRNITPNGSSTRTLLSLGFVTSRSRCVFVNLRDVCTFSRFPCVYLWNNVLLAWIHHENTIISYMNVRKTQNEPKKRFSFPRREKYSGESLHGRCANSKNRMKPQTRLGSMSISQCE